MATLTKSSLGRGRGLEIFYCQWSACSHTCHTRQELERHVLTGHVSRLTVTDKHSVEEEFSFDNDNDSDEHSISLPESEIRPNSEKKRNKVSDKSAAVKKSMAEEKKSHKSHSSQ